jgi:hypothetical protein
MRVGPWETELIDRRRLLLGAGVLAGSGFSIAGFAAGPSKEPVRNRIMLRDASGSGIRDYPVRIGRPFVTGEIRSLPQAVLGNTKLPTQADVKTRWPDGSVQHAILSFVVPHIPAAGSVVIGFVDQEPAAAAPMSAKEMLDRGFDFDAVLQIAQQHETRSASARAMLEAGDFTVWCDGQIATTVVIADHSAARKYDLGFDDLRSVRPIFHATFWRGLRKVQVRAIGENANTETLQDVEYALVLKTGAAAPVEVFRQDRVPHYAATRWTRAFWIGKAPDPRVDIDHNLAYLAATRAFPNFDSSLRVPDQVVDKTYIGWQKQPKGLYDSGGWVKYMPTTGGRDDIGPYPGIVTKWLYTGDHRLFEAASTMADLAGAWPLQVREGNPEKRFDADGRVPGMGRALSVYARPSLWLFDDRGRPTPQDRVPIHGERILSNIYPKTNGGWHNDGAHEPDPYSALYTLTGDPFALEQMQFWAASQALKYDPGYKGIPASGCFMDEVRGCAWVLRNRVHAAFLSPDGTPEKAYFRGLVDDVVGYWEGRMGIRGTPFEGKPTWQFGQKGVFASPLHFFADQPINDRKEVHASTAAALWEHYMLIFELGRSKEKGLPTGPLLSYLAAVLTGQFKEAPAYSPYNVERYWTGVRDDQHQFFQTWTATLASYKQPRAPTALGQNVADGYATYAYGASTMITSEPGGANAYDWLRRNLYDSLRDRFSENPKWAFVPRI